MACDRCGCSGCSEGGQALEKAADKGFTKSGEDAARRDVNESFFVHGLPKGKLADVLRSGFNERYAGSNAGSLFGTHASAAALGTDFGCLCLGSQLGLKLTTGR
jgi:hypothetical protein